MTILIELEFKSVENMLLKKLLSAFLCSFFRFCFLFFTLVWFEIAVRLHEVSEQGRSVYRFFTLRRLWMHLEIKRTPILDR